ncbi:putative enzyme of thiazole biosynthesis [Marinitoga piezophila KA3]|uniref:thiazole synthase n=1 Tax=Marinitoga piezophila (strain DSM 14283 / JCM 11233 / KA3) TaxID=443254 RepID=H2J7B2_MARPK|nr:MULTISPECIES: thiazole synthase [Marinitoga]AEX85304.1 putative enzyme of thiazole biosynthesis [Marinitoga piezophila KA3]APT75789.1 thiazole synthase [Marinitoga sp. 1137]NUU97457.1 thiazole synthase [Marinitoga sp. 1138]
MVDIKFYNEEINNLFFMGTGKFKDYSIMKKAIEEAKIEVVTVAMRRASYGSLNESILDYISAKKIMVNTSGARNAEEALLIAQAGKELMNTDWIKIEIINDSKYLMPDNQETIKACKLLTEKGFKVFPYMCPDLYDARKMIENGAEVLMPLGSPIGTNKGFTTKELVKILLNEFDAKIIIDAGIGKPSHVSEAMEIGCHAVLANTAVSIAEDPVKMVKAFSLAAQAGRLAYLAGIPEEKEVAEASSPLFDYIGRD